jgi:CRISPR-associated protein Cas5t
MAKAIRIDCIQQMPNYRKPASFLIKESYPLPPYSSVIGMVHVACGFTGYHDMKVSVQGRYASTVSDIATMYNFGIKYDQTRHQAFVTDDTGEKFGINKGIKSAELLTDVRLVLHIQPQNADDFETVLNGLRDPAVYPSLGRYEDLLNIERVRIVELEKTDNSIMCYDAYVPVDNLDPDENESVKGTVYRINKRFEINPKTKLREWKETVLARHVSKDSIILSDNMLVDNDENEPVAVFLV